MPGQNQDPLNPYSELSEDQHKFVNSIPLGPTPGEQLDAAVKSAEALARKQLSHEVEAAYDPSKVFHINPIDNLSMNDFNPQPSFPVANGPNVDEYAFDGLTLEKRVPKATLIPVDEAARAFERTDTPLDPFAALELFDYHAPTPVQVEAIRVVRDAMKQAATKVLAFCPPSAERTLAIRALHLASMQANASIVFDGRKIV